MPGNYWLVKQEPGTYAWSTLLREGRTDWTGIRNFQARNHLRAMQRGELVLFYHSGEEKQVVGLARVERTAYPDPTAEEGDWSAVDLASVKTLPKPVSLAQIKADSVLKAMTWVRQSRLSVCPLTEPQFKRLLEMAGA